MASGDAKAWFWGGLCCSTEAQDGEAAEKEVEEGRGSSGGEAGGLVVFSFSIMVVQSLGESKALLPLSCPVCALQVCLVSAVFLYLYESN